MILRRRDRDDDDKTSEAIGSLGLGNQGVVDSDRPTTTTTVTERAEEQEDRGQRVPLATDLASDTAVNREGAADQGAQHLGDLLVKRGLVTTEQIEQALEKQQSSGGRLGELLIEMGFVDERVLVNVLAEFFGMPVADLRRYKPDPEALALVSEDVARQNMAMPISLHDDGLHVAAVSYTHLDVYKRQAKLDVVNVALPELRVPEPRRVGARLVQFVADAQE